MGRVCRVCGVELDDENWQSSFQKNGSRMCRECNKKYQRSYRDANRDKIINFGGKVCRKCGVELDEGNWYQSLQKIGSYICNACNTKKSHAWGEENPDKVKESSARHRRKSGQLPISENKECGAYLGIYVFERLLSRFFNDVEVMPYGNIGYDFVCNHGKKIDAKSSCILKNKNGWLFNIGNNTIADYFCCVAFDNREDLNPLYMWMLPGDKFNHLITASISPSTLDKWDKYRRPIDGVIACCDDMK